MTSARFLAICTLIAASSALILWGEWTGTMREIDRRSHHIVRLGTRVKPVQTTVKGLYLTAYSAGTEKKLDEIIALIDRTELNAVVIDIKDYSGTVLFPATVPLTKELGLTKNTLGDVGAVIKKLHRHGIYVIARQTVFQDPLLASKKPEWAIRSKTGGVWRDRKGLSWVDPTRREIWEYNAALAREAIRLGFDEINFDYVRFPTDGNMSDVVYTNGEDMLFDVMGKFYAYLHDELGSLPAPISLDFFGFVMERHDGMTIGQRLEDARDRVDVISPMMYPSHYPAGHLGFANPADYPREVIDHGLTVGLPYVASSTTKIRPWIQAFNLGAVYSAEKIRAEIDAVEKHSDAGWLLWNAANRYTDAGLQPAELPELQKLQKPRQL